MTITDEELIKKAQEVAVLHEAPHGVRIGDVGCALISEKGNVYTGASIHACCGVGFCCEHAAIAAMVTKQEYRIKKIVAVVNDGTIAPPCGRCREIMYQVDPENINTEVIVDKGKVVKLRELLPEIWQERFKTF